MREAIRAQNEPDVDAMVRLIDVLASADVTEPETGEGQNQPNDDAADVAQIRL